jgi:hypothetical protein
MPRKSLFAPNDLRGFRWFLGVIINEKIHEITRETKTEKVNVQLDFVSHLDFTGKGLKNIGLVA